ncbi:hypothetical protein M427DRAFT_70138 [Gonapodya prolifera JEL478]|uniref:Solute carrier family 40 member n=1 Tax=Gonapodya prolifera (strain JEL478) TaxID=1344416 RepID=A0A139AEQ3_GONPJ|nr:hypothetical protein M427DRAFT_70138 [Gonapodya prolifera JEL478]|eukprot:KXS15306.1 hypothetical protein M427DRAFT_70138 [Gonapodya prolifera JEL478]
MSSSSGDRLYDFSSYLFIVAAFPGSLVVPSLFGLLSTLASVIFTPPLGALLDSAPRLAAVRTQLVAGKVSTVLASVAFLALLTWAAPVSPSSNWSVCRVPYLSNIRQAAPVETHWGAQKGGVGGLERGGYGHDQWVVSLLPVVLTFFLPVGPSWSSAMLFAGHTGLAAGSLNDEGVEPAEVGEIIGWQAALCNLAMIAAYGVTIGWGRPEDFGWPIVASFCAVVVAACIMSAHLRKERGHLVHLDKLKLKYVMDAWCVANPKPKVIMSDKVKVPLAQKMEGTAERLVGHMLPGTDVGHKLKAEGAMKKGDVGKAMEAASHLPGDQVNLVSVDPTPNAGHHGHHGNQNGRTGELLPQGVGPRTQTVIPPTQTSMDGRYLNTGHY